MKNSYNKYLNKLRKYNFYIIYDTGKSRESKFAKLKI